MKFSELPVSIRAFTLVPHIKIGKTEPFSVAGTEARAAVNEGVGFYLLWHTLAKCPSLLHFRQVTPFAGHFCLG